MANGLRLQGRRETGPEEVAILQAKAGRDLTKLLREGGEGGREGSCESHGPLGAGVSQGQGTGGCRNKCIWWWILRKQGKLFSDGLSLGFVSAMGSEAHLLSESES